MPNSRVSSAGKLLGSLFARAAKSGRARLEDAGLTKLSLPMLRDEMCTSCACRDGTVPNGCLQTQMDLAKAVIEGRPFLCHAPRDGRMCAGWTAVRAEHVAQPLPAFFKQLADDWEYSPPDKERGQ